MSRAEELGRSELEDHAAAFLAEIIQSLVIVEEAQGRASGMMRDSSVLRKVVSERHGAQRKRLGWTEDELRREFEIVRLTVFTALNGLCVTVRKSLCRSKVAPRRHFSPSCSTERSRRASADIGLLLWKGRGRSERPVRMIDDVSRTAD